MTSSTTKGKWKIENPYTKILVILCYDALLGVSAVIFYSITSSDQDERVTSIQKYFLCEATGSTSECDRSDIGGFTIIVLGLVVYSMLGIVPALNLVFVINWTATKDLLRKHRKGAFRKC